MEAKKDESENLQEEKRLKRGYSPSEILSINIPCLPFDGEWEAAIGKPAAVGTWLVWGASANGKSSFVMELAKYLCRFGKVGYDSLEESKGRSFQMSLSRHRMEEVDGRFIIYDRLPMEDLIAKLKKRRSPDFVIIDSFQYSGLSYRSYIDMKEQLPNKLLIFISHARGDRPGSSAAQKVEFDVDVKILVKGFRAVCKSRFLEKPSVPYTVWAEGAVEYWNE